MDRAILPASPPHLQWSRYGSVRSGYRKDITTSRSANATTTIQNRERRALTASFGLPAFCSFTVSEDVIHSHRTLGSSDHLLCHNGTSQVCFSDSSSQHAFSAS